MRLLSSSSFLALSLLVIGSHASSLPNQREIYYVDCPNHPSPARGGGGGGETEEGNAGVIQISSVIGDLPAKAGKTLTVKVLAEPNHELNGGQVVMDVKVMGVKVATRNFKVCKDLGLECPVKPGEEVEATFHFPVPWYAVTMIADVVINAFGEEGQSLACVQAPNIPVVRGEDSFLSSGLPTMIDRKQQGCGWAGKVLLTAEMCQTWRDFVEDGLVLVE